MTSSFLRLAGLIVALGLTVACAGISPAAAAAPKSKFEQAKIKAGLIYKKYYKAAFDSSILGPEFKEVHEEASRLREQFNKALDEAVDLDPNVRRTEDALKRAQNKPEDKQDPEEILARTEDVQIVRQNARGDIESEAHGHVFDVVDDDDDTPKKPVACGEADQKRIQELQTRIEIYEKRLADAEQEARNINQAIQNSEKDGTTQIQLIELRDKNELLQRRIKRLKHNIEEYKTELNKVLNPPPCPAPSTSKQDDKPAKEDKPVKKASKPVEKKKAEKEKDKGETGVNVPAIAIDVGVGIMRHDRRDRDDRRRDDDHGRGGIGIGGGFGGLR
jgi:hypothetical protein